MGYTILYIMFVVGLMGSATGVVLMRTPVHSLLLLVMTFFNAAGLFLVWGAEFLAMMLVVVYVGAVAVLFLFAVMMLDIDQELLKFKYSSYTGFSAIVAFALFIELIIAILPWKTWEKAGDIIALPIPAMITNTHLIGSYLYTQYFYIFQISGLLLLLAMIGAILLTLRDRRDVNHQKISDQVNREPSDTLRLVKVPFKKGVDI
ncbi:MAG: NADH-quinone oxidoreductase subunit J [Proteobacteria bacterium]|nr:NADH-quinone oxidoreductase subunit J [Pseudomonadota bacterium]